MCDCFNSVLDDRKNFQFKKRGIGIESESKLEIKKVWKQVKVGVQ